MKLPPSLFDDSSATGLPRAGFQPQQTPLREGYFAPQGVWRPRPVKRRATSAAQGASVGGQSSYLYVFVHAKENRLKIGRSDVPLRRLSSLPEAEHIDHIQSFRVELPDRQRAREVESLLHKALADYRLQLTFLNASSLHRYQLKGWDGMTEWFRLSGMRHVLDLLRALPESTARQGASLQTLDGQPYVMDAPMVYLKEADRRREEARKYNLGQLDHICDALLQIRRHLNISWQESKAGDSSALRHGGILRVHGYKGWWDLENLTPRMGLTDHALWNLKTGKASQPERTCHRTGIAISSPVASLVCLIRFAIDQPNDLELVFSHPDRLRQVPASSDIRRRWFQFRKALTA